MELDENVQYGCVILNFDWTKLILSIASTLFRDIILAKNLFLEKHAIFKKLSAIYADDVPEWNQLDRESRVIPRDKEVRCVYRQYSKKGSLDSISSLARELIAVIPVPSRARIYQALLTELETETNVDLAPTIPSFLNEAILILEEQ